MPVYRYRAVNETGNPQEGTMEESSAHRVTTILRERGLEVNSVEEVGRKPLLPLMRKGLTWEDISLFNDYLSATVKSGLPLAPALKVLAEDLQRSPLKQVLEDVHTRLNRGETLEAALSAHPDSFPPAYLAAIHAGEQTGNLQGVLQHLSAYAARMSDLKARIRETMAYPFLVVLASAGVLAFLMFEIIPLYADIFADFGGRLPWLTQFWLDVSYNLRTRYVSDMGVAAVLVVIGILVRKLIQRSEPVSYALERVRLFLRAGRARYYGVVTEFSQSLGMLLSSRVPIVESLDLASAVSRSVVLRRAVRQAAQQVEHGAKLHDALRGAGFFDPFYVWMIGVAEDRGELDTGMLTLASTYEERLDRSTRMFLRFLGPAVIVAMGLVVASVVIAMYMPIFSLGDVISGR